MEQKCRWHKRCDPPLLDDDDEEEEEEEDSGQAANVPRGQANARGGISSVLGFRHGWVTPPGGGSKKLIFPPLLIKHRYIQITLFSVFWNILLSMTRNLVLFFSINLRAACICLHFVCNRIPLGDLRKVLMGSAHSILSIQDFETEGEVISLATRGIKKTVNAGRVGGHFSFVPRVILTSINCKNAFPIQCFPTNEYRTISGVCNNNQNDVLWGAQSSVLLRFVPSAYADHRHVPRGGFASAANHCKTGFRGTNQRQECGICISRSNALLPNPRTVSHRFHLSTRFDDRFLTVMFIIFAQFLDHDLTLTPEFESEGGCCLLRNRNDRSRCFNVFNPSCVPPLPTRQVTLQVGDQGVNVVDSTEQCMSFSRSSTFCNNTAGMREQFNALTAYIDSSNVYGSTPFESTKLRAFRGGFLKEGPNRLLPFEGQIDNILAGDVRAKENVMLVPLHALFVREHNRLAIQFQQALPNGNDEIWFQEARRLVWAQFQNIVYGQFLQILLGNVVTRRFNLTFNLVDSYQPNINAGITNEFATAAYRFGHSGLTGLFETRSLRSGRVRVHKLQDHFFNLQLYYQRNGEGMEELINGMIFQATKSIDRFISRDVTQFLFANVNGIGQDLAARNIQRGRDHGLAGYNAYREFCGMPRACSWSSPPFEIGRDRWEDLSELYTSPSDIDLFVGGLAERPHEGGIVGRTFSCLLARQFHSLKFGDR